MSDPADFAIDVAGVGKMYKIFRSRLDNFVDALGIHRVLPWRQKTHREFWALRDIELQVERGKRVGIVGSNGAGKSTLLKLITGNIPPTEGLIRVRGEVHALMNTGAGFHPEFTGRDNIKASLIYQGLNRSEIEAAVGEIADFTELEEFLDQPFKTYSAGMQARLTFATATTIKPEVLIIDEVLGAGDSYFVAKSTERISNLVRDHRATVLIVSHALDMVTRFCEDAIWIERGKIVGRGSAMEVVKSYEQFQRVRNERRLRAKNQMRAAANGKVAADFGTYRAHFVVRVHVEGSDSAELHVSDISLREGSEAYEHLDVGDAQDSDTSRSASILLSDSSGWSAPEREGSQHFRSLTPGSPPGESIFYLHDVLDGVDYSIEVGYRGAGATAARLEVQSEGQTVQVHEIADVSADWTSVTVPLPRQQARVQSTPAVEKGQPSVKRWPGEGSITISEVALLDEAGQTRGVFEAGEGMSLRMTIKAVTAGEYPVVPTSAVYRLDGVPITRHRGAPFSFTLEAGEERVLRLDFGKINLGDGHYVVSVGAFREFDAAKTDQAKPYEIIDRSYEFEIVGNPPNMDAVFQHPGSWTAKDE